MEKKWYKKWWGILIIIGLFYIFVPYFVWTKTNWSRPAKIAITLFCLVFFVMMYFNNDTSNQQKLEKKVINIEKEVSTKPPTLKETDIKSPEVTLTSIPPSNIQTNTYSEKSNTTSTPKPTKVVTTPTQVIKTTSVTLQQITMIENNHVGNNWTKSVSVNGKVLSLNNTVAFDSEALNVSIKITENDKYPDVATENTSLKKGINDFTLVVTEDRGRYAHNTASWKVSINVE